MSMVGFRIRGICVHVSALFTKLCIEGKSLTFSKLQFMCFLKFELYCFLPVI